MPANSAADQTSCVVAGGGPAGIMLGLLLARAGIDVTVMEKFRIAASTPFACGCWVFQSTST